MRTSIYQVDAFTTRRFAGNPAAVMPMRSFPDADTMQAIAAENNLPETALVVPDHGDYRLRWFTPKIEVPLCGHATLASAAVVMERLEPMRDTVVFHTASGALTVRRAAKGYAMDLPQRLSRPVQPPEELSRAVGARPVEVLADSHNYLVRVESAEIVRTLAPDLGIVEQLDRGGLIVTAAGDRAPFDIVSRYFAPAKGIPEDPVTGGAHCALAPYWCERLGKDELHAYQASPRGGQMTCRLRQGRVELEGTCVFYLEGTVEI